MPDGVPTAIKSDPLDVDRALKKLKEIKKDVTVWWASGAQSAQVLKDGEVDMALIWNGRAEALAKEVASVGIDSEPADPPHRLLDCPERRAEQGSCDEGDRDHDARPEAQVTFGTLHQLRARQRQGIRDGLIQPEVAKDLLERAGERQEGFCAACHLIGPITWTL